MSENVDEHQIWPNELTLDRFDTSLLHIWQDEESLEMWVTTSATEAPEPCEEGACRFQCQLSEEAMEVMAAPSQSDAQSRISGLKLRVSRTLLAEASPAQPNSSDLRPIEISDLIVGELAAAVITTLRLGKHNSYTVACMAKMLCARLSQFQANPERRGGCQFEDWQLAALREALNGATEEYASVAHIARRCRLSVCHFSRLFRATFGMPLHRYRVDQRIKQAKLRLIGSSDPISQIALDCGFADQASFTRRFTAVSGVSPAMWRRRAGRGPVPWAVQGRTAKVANA